MALQNMTTGTSVYNDGAAKVYIAIFPRGSGEEVVPTYVQCTVSRLVQGKYRCHLFRMSNRICKGATCRFGVALVSSWTPMSTRV